MITPEAKTIGEIFLSTFWKLSVPRYQRDYNRGTAEIEELIEDIASLDDERELFLGNFIFDIKDSNNYEIVDGQQRITTISLILIAVRQIAKTQGIDKMAQALQTAISFKDPLGNDVGEKVSVSPSILNLYRHMCLYDRDGAFPNSVLGVRVVRQVNKVKPVYDFVYNKLISYEESTLASFITKLYKSYVTLIKVDNDEDVFDIFERTNARGIDLNISDLLKNYVFKQQDRVGDSDYEDTWTEIVDNAGGTLPRMLKYYRISRKGYVMKSGLYKKLKGYTKEISFNIFLKDLLDFSNFYKAVQSDSKDEITRFFEGFELDLISNNESYIDEITRVFQALKLFKVTQAYPIIYSILVCYKKHIQNMPDQFIKPDKLIALLKAFEKYHFINNMIASRIGNEVEKLYAESAKIFFNSNDFAKLSLDFIEGLREKKATKEEFITHFKEVSYADGMLIHYIFDRINNFSIKGGNIFPLYTPEKGEQKRNFNIEHILPQSEKKSVDQSLVEKIDSIGNLLIVSRHTNSGPLNNKMPIEKFRILEDPQHSGTLKYIKDFIEQYGSNTKWGTDEIDQRAHDLAELGYNTVWNI